MQVEERAPDLRRPTIQRFSHETTAFHNDDCGIIPWPARGLRRKSPPDERTIEDIRHAVLRLPYYGVFDFLAFEYEKGKVTLSGFVYQPSLKREVVSAVKRVARVDEVVDTIEELPLSPNDDRIRWQTFYQIYNDSSLSRYAPGGGLSRFDRRFQLAALSGDAAVRHVSDSHRRAGWADAAARRRRIRSSIARSPASAPARSQGTFGVENELVITAEGKGR